MKKIAISLLLVLIALPSFSQAGDDYPLRIFETSILIDNQTVATPFQGMLEFEIHHRFGTVNSVDDLFGIWAPANIRLGLNYGITDRLMAGIGTAKNYKAQDLSVKYALLRQTASGAIPVSVAYYGNIGLNLLDKNTFGPAHDWREIHRISYFNQILIARQFGEELTLQLAPTFIWFNAVEVGYRNAHYGISAGAKLHIAGSHNIIAEYDQLFNGQKDSELNSKPQIAFGWEVSTATHAFQLFLANYKDILGQYNFVYNQNGLSDGKYLLGLNITVRF